MAMELQRPRALAVGQYSLAISPPYVINYGSPVFVWLTFSTWNQNLPPLGTGIRPIFLDFSSEICDPEKAQLEKALGELRSECERRKTEALRTQAALHGIKAQVASAQTWEAVHKRATTKIIKMTNCMPELRATNESLQEANRDLTIALELSKSESISLKSKLGTAEQQITTFDEERRDFQNKVEELERQLSALHKDCQIACDQSELSQDRTLRCDGKLRVTEALVATLQATKSSVFYYL
ncbi:uncharacterized protein EV420DRAFT_1698851 [Desarmillaria tabescens]|uniref:Uncharacterized protein n=1 Tax=Armillaria tabescens TaxID=1929756 RepID=A0AA39NJN4_ARMTA|nr:uncharacterized protein EV420DRAFT_1698851 [Desarmillaria tabescens]KAK0466851.1 hypothetical protein EV420DRAFT_1698851 [Desarmillaria tabescens]